MTDQDLPLQKRLGMDYDHSPPWTSFNMVMVLNIGLPIKLPVHRITKEGMTALELNNKITYQRQSYLHGTPTGMQVVLIPISNDINHPVPAIVEEHKLYFNPPNISLMFMWNSEKFHTWDICAPLDKNTPNIAHNICNILKVPIPKIDEDTIDFGNIHDDCRLSYPCLFSIFAFNYLHTQIIF